MEIISQHSFMILKDTKYILMTTIFLYMYIQILNIKYFR